MFGLESCIIDASVDRHMAVSQFLDLSNTDYFRSDTFGFGTLLGLVKLATFLVSTI